MNLLTFNRTVCLFFFQNLISTFGILYSQLELCGGLTPISERSARASCDDADSHTQVSLLAEAEEPNTNTNTYNSEDNSIIQPCYTATVCHTTHFLFSFVLLWLEKSSRTLFHKRVKASLSLTFGVTNSYSRDLHSPS